MRRVSVFSEEIKNGERFKFGDNWKSFLHNLDDERIEVAIESLKSMLGVEDLKGKTFLDIGCGSGLFSLAAHRLGARVHSIDYDSQSVNCTVFLKEKYGLNSDWVIEEGSVLDKSFIESLGRFDIVYSWGVLHHTGDMYTALDFASIPVKQNGKLFIALYNDQGARSKAWKLVKKIYNKTTIGRFSVIALYTPYYWSKNLIADIYLRQFPLKRYREFKQKRGMSWRHDLIDWLGGYPFEVADTSTIFHFFKKRGFQLEELKTKKGRGCNQFVFVLR